MFLQWGDGFALICFCTAVPGSFRWQGDTCVWVELHKVNVGPQERNFSPLGFMQHDLFITPHVCRSGLWAVHMCWYVPCCPTPPCGFSLEKVASSYMCERKRGSERWWRGKKRKAYVWIEWHKKIIIAEDSLNRVGGKIPHFETIPAFQIVKLTFSAAVASERG